MKGMWTLAKEEGDKPSARSSHGVSLVQRQDGVYTVVFGGEYVARTPIDASIFIGKVSPATATVKWEKIVPTDNDWPLERVGHAQASDEEGGVWIFGGRQGIDMSEKALNDLWRFDVESHTWEKFEKENAPCARSFHRIACAKNRLFCFGGCGENGRLADLHMFDTTTKTWTELPKPDIAGRGGACLAVNETGTHVAVVGGFIGNETNDICILDVESGVWTKAESEWLRPRSVCVSFVFGNNLCIFGGEVEPSSKGHEGAGGFAGDLVCLDITTGAPVELQCSDAASPPPRGWSDGDSLGDLGVLFGGLAGDDANPVRHEDFWVLNLSQ